MATTPTSSSTPILLFRLPDYDAPFRSFVNRAIHELARAKDPLLSQIRTEEVEEVGTSRVTGELETVELPPVSAQLDISFEVDDLVAGASDNVIAMLDGVAEQHLRQVMPAFFESISRITDATGNRIEAKGEPFSPELLLEALEKIEWSFDENDEPIMPTLVVHPTLAEKIAQLPPLTPEQEKAFSDQKERKRDEYRARKRRRKLS
jgi:hypothetical protein